MAQMVDPGWIPGREDPLEKGMATHSGILSWSIPLTEDTVHGVTNNQTGLGDPTLSLSCNQGICCWEDVKAAKLFFIQFMLYHFKIPSTYMKGFILLSFAIMDIIFEIYRN